jgi:hypothetical protein
MESADVIMWQKINVMTLTIVHSVLSRVTVVCKTVYNFIENLNVSHAK